MCVIVPPEYAARANSLRPIPRGMRITRELEIILGSDWRCTLAAMLQGEQNDSSEADTPLPATLTFVFLMGVTFLILWFGVFMLLKARW